MCVFITIHLLVENYFTFFFSKHCINSVNIQVPLMAFYLGKRSGLLMFNIDVSVQISPSTYGFSVNDVIFILFFFLSDMHVPSIVLCFAAAAVFSNWVVVALDSSLYLLKAVCILTLP